MYLHELPFAKIILLRKDIAEVIVNEGVVMSVDMVNQYHDFLLEHLHIPFSLLINKINSYTYDFDAQLKLATLNEINAMAVVSYNRLTTITTENLAAYPRERMWNLKVFTNRDKAVEWLLLQQQNVTSDHGTKSTS